jgi:hypothetical protein
LTPQLTTTVDAEDTEVTSVVARSILNALLKFDHAL